jgi:hypothetical protein
MRQVLHAAMLQSPNQEEAKAMERQWMRHRIPRSIIFSSVPRIFLVRQHFSNGKAENKVIQDCNCLQAQVVAERNAAVSHAFVLRELPT